MPILVYTEQEVNDELNRERGFKPLPPGWYRAKIDMSKAADELTGEEGHERLDGVQFAVEYTPEGSERSREVTIRANLFGGDIIRLGKTLELLEAGKPVDTAAFDGKEVAVRVYTRKYKGNDGDMRQSNTIAEYAPIASLEA